MIFTKLILAHLLGDFILQPNSWVSQKEKNKLRSQYLYFHVFIHTILSFIFLWKLELWWISFFIGITHFIIDASKLTFQNIKTKRKWFFIDQLLHIIVIAGISYCYKEFNFSFLNNRDFVQVLVAIVFLTIPTSIIIKLLLSSWIPVPETQNTVHTESLTNAGKYIGILERLLVFTFIVVNHWEGVGFMVAAKSVFRFSDLAQARQRKLTEYVLIGTLLSFGIAVLIGILIK
ncbi:DUF3307 domain-containing protein [Chryseobacterium potabilaquae]|uniref:DUF3307 domain-containing protein n=1 Tax=Chryseobacterium potabilaquae TaxID=2675057 RepID=A0A6N4X5F4_9FLAO|nr:DUF3307 domain-containing protein [Chryseobacterium potabilaquae]CAA7196246.1 hypothetical protein CHRY9293_02359 [Chryseobacterium potabilaquae]